MTQEDKGVKRSYKDSMLLIALLTFLYILTGKVGLELAVPPGYATMIWPASGIAVGMILLYGWRLWPGIFLGSFLLNAHTSGTFDQVERLLDFNYIMPAISIAAGSTLQAFSGWFLVYRYVGIPLNLSRIQQVLLLFFLCGPLSCLIAPTIGIGTLYSAGILQGHDLAGNWISWWAGDVFGIFLFMPLVLLSPLGRSARPKWQGSILGSLSFLSIVAIILPLGLTFYVWKVTSEESYQKTLTGFKSLAKDSENALLYRVTSYSHALTGGHAYFKNVNDMTREKWNNYISSISIKENYPGINGVGVIYQVTSSEKELFISRARKEFGGDFSIHPEVSEKDHYVIKYIYPEEGNQQAIGLDIAFEKNRREAAEISRDTGMPAITKKVILVQDNTKSPGFLLLYPIYKEGVRVSTQEQKRKAIKGWVYAPFIAGDFLQKLTQGQGKYFNIHIYDGGEEKPENLIYSSDFDQTEHAKPGFKVTKKLEIMQQEWLVVWESTPSYERKEQNQESFIILVWGIFFTGLFSIFLVLFSVRKLTTLELIVKERGYVLPIVIFIITFSAALYLHKVVRDKEHNYLVSLMEGQADSMITISKADYREIVLAIQRFGSRWSVSGARTEDLWNTDAKNYIHDFFSLRAIVWVDRNNLIKKIYPLSGYEKQIGLSIADSPEKERSLLHAAEKNETLISAPTQFQNGLLGILVYVPIKRNGEKDGFIIGGLPLKNFFDFSFAKENFDGYFISIEHKGSVVYTRSALDVGDLAPVSVHRNFYIGGHEYDIYLSPLKEDIESRIGRLPLFILISGLVISALLSALARFVLIARIRLSYLRDAISAAETANKSKSLFLANISHEIRTPLNGILATTELLETTNLDSGQRKYVDIVHNSGQLLFNLLNDVLDLSKIEIHKLELHKMPFDLAKTITLSIELFSSSALQKNIDLSWDISPELPEWVLGDQHRFGQILTNMVGNAVKYTEKGYIHISASKDQKIKDGILIEVRDTGIGIPESSISSIFDRFTQAHALSRIVGTGLGLAISKSLVEMMEGEIGVRSKEGEGSVFWFRVPLLSCQAPEEGTRSVSAAQDAVFKGCHILLAEDTEANRIIISDMLSYLGCSVETVSNGAEALEICQTKKYDLIFMDCNMPVMDGYEATRKIRDILGKNIPIIAISAHAFSHDIKLCYDAGMNDYVQKPVKLEMLSQAIQKWCRIRNVREDNPLPEKSDDIKEEAVIDLSSITAWVQDEQKIQTLLSMTKRNAESLFDSIIADWSSADMQSLSSNAHALKSVAAQIGGNNLASICQYLESNASTADLKTLEVYIATLEKEYSMFATALSSAING